MPVGALACASLARAARSATRPTARTRSMRPFSVARPAESYPRYSSLRRPSMRMGTTLRSATAPTIPHILLAPWIPRYSWTDGRRRSRLVGFRLLDRALPVLDGRLLRPGNGELAGRGLARERGARPEGGARAHRHRRHQLGVAADEGVVADDRLVLVGAVVVAGDGTRADVDPGADLGIADVGEMVGLRAFAHAGRLHLDEIADMGMGGEFRAGPQPGIGPDARLGPDAGPVDVGEGEHLRARADAGVAQDAVRSDAGAVGDLDRALEDAVDVDRDVDAAGEPAAHVDAGGIGERHAGVEQGVCDVALVDALELRELPLAVDPEGLPDGARLRRDDGHAVGDRGGHDVGQVVLALRVVVRQAGEPALERRRGRDEDAGVDLADRERGGVGVLVL